MKLSIFTTMTDPLQRGDTIREALDCYSGLADDLVVSNGGNVDDPDRLKTVWLTMLWDRWPLEFSWELIGQQFQRGYEACTGDWVIHADLDFIFHEDDYANIRKACEKYNDAPALTFWKYQIFTPERYNLKSRLVIAVNKGKYGDRIRFDGGGDLCQPTLDGKYIDPLSVPEARIPFYNYDEILKTKEQLLEDKGRFARAWQRTFGEYKLGGPDDESAYKEWFKMVEGRYQKHTNLIEKHPKVMVETIKNLTPKNFGFSAFGLKEKYYA